MYSNVQFGSICIGVYFYECFLTTITTEFRYVLFYKKKIQEVIEIKQQN